MENLILLLISTFSFFGYLAFVVYKKGVLPTISDSYYALGMKPLFTLVMFTTAIPVIIVGDSIWMFLAGSALAFVGASPAFKRRTERVIHVVGAISAIVFGMLSLIFNYGALDKVLLTISIMIFIQVGLIPFKNKTWAIEVLAITVILLTMFLAHIK